ncbi:ArsR/SmtB family transcription factor [Streptomyces endophyticus]|uniref:Winged helix-turn-helix domain-containing protein n=1 Tax=Streptomyces endophyticus TaxID=714166 RepID=A0ABU6EXW7_9ACTN|nr:helix-turn-helix domain-containing protein [Streptomyces endophyticus]MEB8336058.1 winged helix-turn-helix domain-containing protein [Streptomyces endophyticus]
MSAPPNAVADSGEAVLRIHFSAGDLARTRIAEEPDPLWEIVLSLHQLREMRREPVLNAWRRRQCPRDMSALRMLSPLMPPRGYFPDFLTPAAGLAGLECGIDAVLSTPRRQLRAEMTLLAAQNSTLPAWSRPLAAGDLGSVHRLGQALRIYHASVLAPAWPQIAARVEGDRRHRTGAQGRLGTEEMLRTFAPILRWQSPVLVADYPVERDIHLQGRGLLLVPSYFCRRTPVALLDEALWPVLVYPARPLSPEVADGPGPRLAPLLGHTRAAVLQVLQEPCTTTELARLAGVSLSSASEHAAVLRRAGLIASTRERHRVHHSLTQLGSHLLSGALVG